MRARGRKAPAVEARPIWESLGAVWQSILSVILIAQFLSGEAAEFTIPPLVFGVVGALMCLQSGLQIRLAYLHWLLAGHYAALAKAKLIPPRSSNE